MVCVFDVADTASGAYGYAEAYDAVYAGDADVVGEDAGGNEDAIVVAVEGV